MSEISADKASSSAVVTGGSRGIGAAIAARWVARGGQIVIADRDVAAGQELVDALGPQAVFVKADATDESQVAEAIAVARGLGGRLDAVFANAGTPGVTGSVTTTDVDDFRATLDLLLTGVFIAFKHGVLAMRDQGHGALVATASVASLRGGLGPHAYTAAKHGVKGLVESLASEVAASGLTVNAVAPGSTVSSLSAALVAGDADDIEGAYARLAAASESGRPTTSDDVAEAAMFLATAQGRINGVCLAVDGGDSLLGMSGRKFHAPASTGGTPQ